MRSLLLILLVFRAAASCPKYIYDPSLGGETCRKVEGDLVLVKSCLSKDRTYCREGNEAICEAEMPLSDIPRYGGEECSNNNRDMMKCSNNLVCSAKRCIGLEKGKDCVNHSDCNAGLACIYHKCAVQVKLGGTCGNDYECLNSATCLFNKCVANYSLPSKSEISGRDKEIVCKSGWSYENKNKLLCGYGKLIGPKECTDTCKYKVGDKVFEMKDRCVCGFNSKGTKYCEEGSDSLSLKKKMKYLKTLFKNPNTVHTLNRFSGFSIDNSTGVQTKIAFALAENEAKLTNTPTKIKPLAVPAITRAVYNTKCPRFYCSMNTGYCAKSLKMEYLDQAALVSRCDAYSVCNTTISHIAGLEDEAEVQCVPRETVFLKQFPGEPCEIDDDCENKNCLYGICDGAKRDEICEETKDCTKGLVCRERNCVVQDSQTVCRDQFDCPNTMGCLNSTCVEYFSLKDNTDLSDLKNTQHPEYLCKSGYLNKELKCFSQDYTPETKERKDDDDLVECLEGIKNCEYTDGTESGVKEQCHCGFNSKGTAYCKVPYRDNEHNFDLYHAKLKESFDYCHTLSRFECVSPIQEEANLLVNLKFQTEEKHLNFGKQGCIDDIFNSTENLAFFYGIFILLGIYL